ncbi:MAG: hypothetical protein WCP70_00640 [Methanothrix sp.]
MKFTEISGKIALIALAAVCLLAAPALSMPMDNGPGRQGHDGMFAPMNNLTAEELANMTLGELKEMRHTTWNNTTACPAKEPGRNCSQWGRNANESLGMKGKGMGEMGMGDNQMRNGPKDGMSKHMGGAMCGAMCGQDDKSGGCDKASMGMKEASPIMLLIDDLTVDDLGNMTVNQIKDLSEKKMQEMDNMTLNQIKQLQDKKAQERDNLTLNQLKEENKNMREIAEILEGLGSKPHIKN